MSRIVFFAFMVIAPSFAFAQEGVSSSPPPGPPAGMEHYALPSNLTLELMQDYANYVSKSGSFADRNQDRIVKLAHNAELKSQFSATDQNTISGEFQKYVSQIQQRGVLHSEHLCSLVDSGQSVSEILSNVDAAMISVQEDSARIASTSLEQLRGKLSAQGLVTAGSVHSTKPPPIPPAVPRKFDNARIFLINSGCGRMTEVNE